MRMTKELIDSPKKYIVMRIHREDGEVEITEAFNTISSAMVKAKHEAKRHPEDIFMILIKDRYVMIPNPNPPVVWTKF